jgi:hypothetical protein
MLLAPFTLSAVSARRCDHGRAAAPRVPAWLLAWAVGGFLAMLLFPALRGGDMAGMSVPFWLLGAPLINLLWLARAHCKSLLATMLRKAPRWHRTQPRVPSRLRSMRRRNSAMMRR